jgi:hypothetical protein
MTIKAEPQRNYYAVITANILYNKKITARQKLLVAMISNMSEQKGFCWASNSHFAECLECDERTIQRDLLVLEELRILNRVINLKPDGSVDFRALCIISDGVTPVSGGGDTHVMGDDDTSVIYNNKDINNKYNKVLTDFELWWELYDKKVGREKALSRWKKLKPSEQQKALDKTSKYIETTPDKKYRKDPTTYLNGKNWEDELDENKKSGIYEDKYKKAIEIAKQYDGQQDS